MSEVTLDSLQKGDKAVVTSVVCAEHCLRNKLLSMGIVKGAILQISHIAPLGDPIKVRILSSDVALRLSEANCILVNSIN